MDTAVRRPATAQRALFSKRYQPAYRVRIPGGRSRYCSASVCGCAVVNRGADNRFASPPADARAALIQRDQQTQVTRGASCGGWLRGDTLIEFASGFG